MALPDVPGGHPGPVHPMTASSPEPPAMPTDGPTTQPIPQVPAQPAPRHAATPTVVEVPVKPRHPPAVHLAWARAITACVVTVTLAGLLLALGWGWYDTERANHDLLNHCITATHTSAADCRAAVYGKARP